MIGTTELMAIAIIGILLFGANKIPEFAKALGKSYGEFKKAKFQTEKEIKKMEDDLNENMAIGT